MSDSAPEEKPTRSRIPDQPPSVMNTTLVNGAFGAAIGAALIGAWDATRNWMKGAKQTFKGGRIASFALNVGIISALAGYIRGQDTVVLHGMAKENEKLHDTIDTLQDEKTALQKSFVTFVKESRAAETQQPTQPTR